MGDYAGYVWSSYGLALIALLWIGVSARSRWQRELKRAQRRIQVAAQESMKEHGT